MNKQYVIIGASAAGIGALRTLLRLDKDASITLITDQQESPYNTCLLADYCAGTIDHERLFLMRELPERVTLLAGMRVVRIMPEQHMIVCDNDRTIPYTSLLLATGMCAVLPMIDGITAQGVFTFHRLRDVMNIVDYAREHAVRDVVIVGAGLSGLEVADALCMRGLNVTIIEQATQVLSGMIAHEASRFITRYAHAAGVVIKCQMRVAYIEKNMQGYVQAVHLHDGSVLATRMVIIAAGVQPNLALARSADLLIGSDGIMVNEYMQTSSSCVYAAGDIIAVYDRVTGTMMRSTTWPDAMQQGLIAAHNMVGVPRAYQGIIPYISSSFFGCKITVCGDCRSLVRGKGTIEYNDDVYEQFLHADGELKGFAIIGRSVHDITALKRSLYLIV
jgi:NAD(P)H-nitrite reductase large subunit